MECCNCKKRWYCMVACPEVNFELSLASEAHPAVRKVISMSWYPT